MFKVNHKICINMFNIAHQRPRGPQGSLDGESILVWKVTEALQPPPLLLVYMSSWHNS